MDSTQFMMYLDQDRSDGRLQRGTRGGTDKRGQQAGDTPLAAQPGPPSLYAGQYQAWPRSLLLPLPQPPHLGCLGAPGSGLLAALLASHLPHP